MRTGGSQGVVNVTLLAELKRRNVSRMAGFYLVGAWLVVQVSETGLPVFDVPSWVLRAIIVVLVLGFIAALEFSWVFELTPVRVYAGVDGSLDDPCSIKLPLESVTSAVAPVRDDPKTQSLLRLRVAEVDTGLNKLTVYFADLRRGLQAIAGDST